VGIVRPLRRSNLARYRWETSLVAHQHPPHSMWRERQLMGYVLAFIFGAIVMGVGMLLYMAHLNKILKRDLQLYLMAEGQDPSLLDEMPPWWSHGAREDWWNNHSREEGK